MIQHFIILNTVGLPRLTKHYTPLPIAKKQALLRGVFSLVSSRPAGSCCFVEDEQVLGTCATARELPRMPVFCSVCS